MLQFLTDNAIYIVMIIVLILWSGIFGFLLNLDRRIKILEKEITGEQNED